MELTDGSGNIVAQYQYDAFGNILSQTGTMATKNPYRYSGYRYDDATGLYYLNARYYDANTGRFITRDTYGGQTSDTLSMNQYAYTKNNTVNFIDPTGHFVFSRSDFNARAQWWGMKIWFSHHFVQTLKNNQLLITGGTAAAVIAPLQYFSVPGWICTLIGGAIALDFWYFYHQDHGGGVVAEVYWSGGWDFVPSY